MKIAYIYSTMAATGGTERMITEKANYLSEHDGYDITIITCFQCKNEENFFKISNKVKQIYLEIPYYSQYKYKYPKRLWVKWQINRLLNKSIKEAVRQINPDILIGVSRFKANYISSLKCKAKKIIECHEVRYNTLHNVSDHQSFPTRVFMSIYSYFYYRTIERHADVVITLTEKDRNLWKRAKQTEVIPNFSTMPISGTTNCKPKRVIAVGRLTWEKGFGRLIEAWRIVSSRHPDWHLDIYGQGQMYETLIALIKLYKASNLVIHNNTSNISQEYANSSICAVTSYFEGFSLILLEAMMHGVPCVAFDCPFGPESIINDASCGFLVENGDTRLFAERLCRLIEDEQLRKDFSKSAIETVKKFNTELIMSKTKNLYQQLVLMK